MTEENIKLFDSELKVMDVLWKDGDVPAKYVADTLNREVGWNKNTTYTLIKRTNGTGIYVPCAYSKRTGTGSGNR